MKYKCQNFLEDNGVMYQRLRGLGMLDVPWIFQGRLESPPGNYVLCEDLEHSSFTKVIRNMMWRGYLPCWEFQ